MPGYREAEEEDSSLYAIVDCLLPNLKSPLDPVPLPIYLGKNALDPKVDTVTSSSLNPGKGSKDFAWSWGIGSKISPIKT